MRSDFSPQDGPRPSPPRSLVPASPSSEGVRSLDLRLQYWNGAIAPYHLEQARLLSIAPRVVGAQPGAPGRVGEIIAHGGAFASAKIFLDLLQKEQQQESRGTMKNVLLAAHARTAASFACYIAKQGFAAQVAEPLISVRAALSEFSGPARTELLEQCVRGLAGLRTSVSVKEHPGLDLLDELRASLEGESDLEVRKRREELLVLAYARMRKPHKALELFESAESGGRHLSLESLAEVLTSAYFGGRDEFAIPRTEDLSRARLKGASISSVCAWGETCLSLGRMDFAAINAARALDCESTPGSSERLRAEALDVAVRVLTWDSAGVRTWPKEFSTGASERVQVLARAAQLVLPLKRQNESAHLCAVLAEHLLAASAQPADNFSMRAEADVCKLIVWSMLTQFPEVAQKLLLAMPPALSSSFGGMETSSQVVSGWLRATAESFRWGAGLEALPADSHAALFFRANGLLDEAKANGFVTASRARELYYLGAQLAACCGEEGPLISMLASAQNLEISEGDERGFAEAGPAERDLGGASETPARAGAEGAVVGAELGVMAYHYARHLNKKPSEVMPAILDLRVEKYQPGLAFLS
jgi:hypothetical protein